MILIIFSAYLAGFFLDKTLNQINGFFSTLLALLAVPFALLFFYNRVK